MWWDIIKMFSKSVSPTDAQMARRVMSSSICSCTECGYKICWRSEPRMHPPMHVHTTAGKTKDQINTHQE